MTSGWRTTTLGELIDVKHGYAFKSKFFTNQGEMLVLTPGNFPIGGGLKLRPDKDRYYAGSYPREFELSAGDLLVVMTDLTQDAPILGSPAIVPSYPKMLHNQRLGLVTVKPDAELDRRFLYYVLLSDASRRQLRATATGTTVRHTAPERIYNVTVELPPLPLQRNIGAVLGAIDDLIATNRARAAVLDEMAQALYHEWFVRLHFPGYHNATFVDSPLGEIPDDWTVIPLGQVAKVNQKNRVPEAGETIRYLDISALNERSVGNLATLVGSDAPGRARRVVAPGDVVWSMVRPNRRAHALLVAPADDWIASTGLAVLTPTSVSSAYLFEAVSSRSFTDYLTSRATGAAYPAVRPKDFESASLLVPSSAIDSQFDTTVGPLHQSVWNLREQSDILIAVRDLLLPKLVTGKVDVSMIDLDSLVEGAVA